jgi:hypothetical protein
MKTTLSIAGLICDLVGATLFAVPMIWDVDASLEWLDEKRRSIDELAARFEKPAKAIGIAVLLLDMVAIPMRLFSFLPAIDELKRMGRRGETLPPDVILGAFTDPLLLTLFFLLFAGLVLSLFFNAMTKLSLGYHLFLMWVKEAKRDRERHLGYCGLFILCLGFVLQFIMNLLS